MPSFHNGNVEIAYLDEGEGDPIVLVHGFASTGNVNWVYPAWVSELQKNGRRVIALDNRGHGDSAKLYDAEAYDIPVMAGDVSALMDHLELDRADIMGYSLGARMTAWLALRQPQRLRSAIFGGIGTENEDRHPKIRRGVLIGAGAKILGNIEVGHCARIAAGSVVVKPVPHNVTVAGVPAKIVGEAGCAEPSRTMDQMINAMGL